MSSSNLREASVVESGAPVIGALLDGAEATLRELLDRCPPGDPMRPGLGKALRSLERLAALTGRFGTADDLATRAAPIDLNGVVREMAAPLQRLLGPFITLETALYSPAIWVAGARAQIEQITLGLAVNAREALPLGGKVRLATRRAVLADRTRYRVGTLDPGTWAILEVQDNGAGIDGGMIHHLLEPSLLGLPFDSSLSLSTVSALVRAAGGQVIVDMPDGGGTVLAACFPAVQSPRIRQPATGRANAILIIDEDEWSRMSASRALRHAGFGVLEAGHSDDAFDLLGDVAGSCVRLIIADAEMLMAGPRPLAERLRRERPEIDLVVTAAHRSSTGGDGQTPVLTKPFAPEELLRVIRDRLPALA